MGWIEILLGRRADAEWREETCKDGSTKRVYYDIDKAFPIHIAGWQGEVRLDLDASIAAEYSTLIQHVAEHLGQENARINLAFRGAYLLYQGDPCNNEDEFRDTLRFVRDGHEHYGALRGAIDNLVELARTGPDRDEFFESSEMKAVERLSGNAPLSELTSYRISEARAQMAKSIGETKK